MSEEQDMYYATEHPEKFPGEPVHNQILLTNFRCGECGHGELILTQWGKKFDAELECPECDNKVIMR